MAVDAAAVAGWGKFDTPTGADLTLMNRVIAATIAHVNEHYIVATPLTDAQELAVILQASRFWKRRDTPEGLAGLGDGTIVRVTGLDKDVDLMLSKKIAFA